VVLYLEFLPATSAQQQSATTDTVLQVRLALIPLLFATSAAGALPHSMMLLCTRCCNCRPGGQVTLLSCQCLLPQLCAAAFYAAQVRKCYFTTNLCCTCSSAGVLYLIYMQQRALAAGVAIRLCLTPPPPPPAMISYNDSTAIKGERTTIKVSTAHMKKHHLHHNDHKFKS
jgi:hypothetical protein